MGYFRTGAHNFYPSNTIEIQGHNSSAEEVNDLLSNELAMTTVALKSHPKVYWLWTHRQWCLENVPDGPGQEDPEIHGWKKANWDRELFVVEKMLDADSRNCTSAQSFFRFLRS